MIAIAVVIITINAWQRVKYFGAVERQYWESRDAAGDAGLSEDAPSPERSPD